MAAERAEGSAPWWRDAVVYQVYPRSFQNYALYPHMTARENMAFPLKLANAPAEQLKSKVEEAAKILDLEHHLDRKPGGQAGRQVIAGIRPESFEDASLVGDARDHGQTFRAKIDLAEWVDLTRLHLFDPDSGESLTRGTS